MAHSGPPSLAAIYCRISSDREGLRLGVQRQEQDCRALAARLGYEVGQVFVDNDAAASTRSRAARPAFADMLGAVETGDYGAVLAYSASRLTRRPMEFETVIGMSERTGVRIATVVSGEDDLSTADGRMLARLKASIDAAEAERIGERVRRQKQQRADQGLMQGGRFRAFGYSRSWKVISSEAEVVREMFGRRVAGESTTAIAKDLNRRGLATTAGGSWRQPSVASMLGKAHYCGLVSLNGQIVGRAQHEPIVDEATWRAANSHVVSMQPGHNTRRHLLSGILRCGLCKESMVGQRSSRDSTSYRCNRNIGGCGRVSIRAFLAEDVVVSLVMAGEVQRPVIAPQRAPAPSPTAEAIDARIAALHAAHDAAELDLADLLPMLKSARARLRAAHQAEAQATRDQVMWEGPIVAWGEWVRADLSARRALLGRHVSGVVVAPVGKGPKADPTRLTLHWARGSTQQVMPDDLTGVPCWSSQRRSLQVEFPWTIGRMVPRLDVQRLK